MKPFIKSVYGAAIRPIDIASLAAFRILFGTVMCVGILRFLFTGWIEIMYDQPRWFFAFPGFAWVKPWPAPWMYVHYAALAALAACVAVGWHSRAALALFLLGFGYTQLIDVTNYLNHHYLVMLLGGLLLVLPTHHAWSLDARAGRSVRRTHLPAWMLWLVRFQVAVVYGFAGLAKANTDWLLYGQPLNLWLSARTEFPLLGRWFEVPEIAVLMSWIGFLFDTTIVLWLSWRRTRVIAYAAVLGFHGLTGALFNIGMFPIIMSSSALVFFSPQWPRRLLRRIGLARVAAGDNQSAPRAEPTAVRTGARWKKWAGGAVLGAYVVMQLGVPLRHLAYPGDVLWNELGMRFAWHVMIREKHGSVVFEARLQDGRRLEIPAHNYLTPRQAREMGGQPDLIAQLAQAIGRDLEARGHRNVAVHARTAVSLNGRRPQAIIDPEIDLFHADLSDRRWILPAPAEPPPQVRPVR
jgi:vitamin K-dependent gamma-carboxylase